MNELNGSQNPGILIEPGQISYKLDPVPRTTTLDLSQATSLSCLSISHIFISYDALLIHGQLPVDPVAHWFLENPKADKAGLILSDQPIFTGLSPLGNHSILAVPKQIQHSLLGYLDMITAADRDKKVYWRILKQHLPLVDFLYLNKKSSLPSQLLNVPLITYSVDSNIACWHFRPSLYPAPIQLICDSPLTDTVSIANQFFQRDMQHGA